MTRGTILVTADWAQHGKTRNDRGYRLLHWSAGTVGRRNFEEALTRYSPGTLDDLPQVTVSFLPSEFRNLDYLAISIHQFPEDERYDIDGRKVVLTNYFCIPYRQLAAGAISYRAMYETFRTISLPRDGDTPISVELPVTAPWAPSDELALQVAALLLTNKPVCVLDANGITVADRLRFIDSVMSLLPYGMRSRMSASTWTSSTYRGHRFRLFFSNAPRETDDQDHAVNWGRPESSPIMHEQGHAYDYLVWLQDRVHQPVLRLAEQTDELGFRPAEVRQMLELLGVTSAQPILSYSSDQQDLLHSARSLSSAARTGSQPGIADILVSCAGKSSRGDINGLKADVAWLRNQFSHSGPPPEHERRRCRDIISTHGLLRSGPGVTGGLEAAFYKVLLQVAFGTPLSYEAYCQVEDCLSASSDEQPQRALLEVIDRSNPHDARVLSLVLWYLGGNRQRRWLRSGQVDAGQLIAYLAGPWPRVQHAKIVCEVVLQYLRDMPRQYDRHALLRALRDCAYLAPALQARHPEEPAYQVAVLTRLLETVFGNRLDRQTATGILADVGEPPTIALLAANLLMLADPADAALAGREFLRSALSLTDFDEQTRTYLTELTVGSPLTNMLAPESRPGPASLIPDTRQSWPRHELADGSEAGPHNKPGLLKRRLPGLPWSAEGDTEGRR